MRDRDHNDLARLNGIDDAEWEASDQYATKPVADRCSQLKSSADSINSVLYVIEEIVAKPGMRGLVEECRLGHLFLRGRKEPIANHLSRLRALSIASSPGTDLRSPRR